MRISCACCGSVRKGRKWFGMAIALLLVGCRAVQRPEPPQMRVQVPLPPNVIPEPTPMQSRPHGQRIEVSPLPAITGAFEGSVQDVAAALQRQGVTLGYDAKLAGLLVRGTFVDRPGEEVLAAIAAQLGRGVAVLPRAGGVRYLGEPEGTDLFVDVFRGTGNEVDLMGALKLAGTKRSEVAKYGDSVVVRDTAEGLDAVQRLHEQLMAVRKQWTAEVTFVEVSERKLRALGVDYGLAAGFDVTAGDVGATGQLLGTIRGLLESREENASARVLDSVVVQMLEGQTHLLQAGDRVPVPRRVVLPETGQVVDTDYQMIETGFVVHIAAFPTAGGGVRVRVEPEISNVTGFVGNYPILSSRRMSSEVVMVNGGSVILGGLVNDSDKRTEKGLANLDLFRRRERQEDRRRLYIILRLLG
jgi:hypothetical protein